jgi:pimeloyl-ACP methyl ester carboxylesterase
MIRSLTLVEPSSFHLLRGGSPDEQALFCEIASVADAVKEAVSSGDYWGGMTRFVDYWNGEGAWDAMPHKARMTLSQRLGKVMLDFRALFEEPADLEDYAALSLPTLILCGERSPGPSRRIVEMLAAAMPLARLERIPGAGHMSPLTHPDAVNAAIREHLSRTAMGATRQACAA